MKINAYEEEEASGNIIKIWLEPENTIETRLLEKIRERIPKINPIMLSFLADWWEEVETRKPKLLIKLPVMWEK